MKNFMEKDNEEQLSESQLWAIQVWQEFKSKQGQLCILPIIDHLLEKLQFCQKELSNVNNNGDLNIYSLLACGLCDEMYCDPMTLQCGHTFCKLCLKRRETALYIEPCFKCGNQKYKWSADSRNIVTNLSCDVSLASIIENCFLDKLKSIKLRHEGNILFGDKELAAAEEKYQCAIRTYPDSFLSWSNLSLLKVNLNHYASALECAKKAILISPTWSKGYYHEGIAYKSMKKYAHASVSFLKYLILDPGSKTVKLMLFETMKHAVKDEYEDLSPENTREMCEEQEKNDLRGICENGLKLDEVIQWVLNEGFLFISSLQQGHQKIQPSPEFLKKVIDRLQTELTCPLCCRLVFHATTTPCGHTFCTSCLERSLDYSNKCSICRESIDQLINLKPKPINDVLESLSKTYFSTEYEERLKDFEEEKELFLYEQEDMMIPIFVCALSLPTVTTSLHIYEPRYKLMIRRCLESNSQMFGMCMPEGEEYCDYGTVLEIKECRPLDDGRLLLDTVGGRRFKIMDRSRKDGYNIAKVKWLYDEQLTSGEKEEVSQRCEAVHQQCSEWFQSLPPFLVCRIRVEVGDLPELSTDAGDELHGPKWIWWMIRLLTEGSNEKSLQALKSTTYEERLNIIIERLQSLERLIPSRT